MNLTEYRLMGIDVGTTSLKAAVFDGTGKRLGVVSRDYTLDTDPKTGYVEFDPEKYIEMCHDAIAELSQKCGKPHALAVDTQGETLILADADGRPLCPAVVWLDNRAADEAALIEAHFGKRKVYEVTGQPEITASWPASKLLWFRRNRPEVWEKTEKIFLLEDYIIFRLTGEFVTEPTIQSSSVYFDIRERRFWREMLDFIGVDERKLPRVLRTAEKAGCFDGITVVCGALDQIAGAVGVGVTDTGEVSEMTGTALAVCAVTDKIPPYRADSIVPCHLHVDGKYCLLLWSATAGMALKWFRNNFAAGLSFRELDAEAEGVAPGCDGLTVLPYFCGSSMPKYDPTVGAEFSGVRLAHTRAHFARAIMESVAFTLREELEYENIDAEAIRITGGGASSPLWAQIKADVTGKELATLEESETACLGSALLAAVGIGLYKNAAEASRAAVKIKGKYSPSGADYSAAYRRFCERDGAINK